MTVQKFTRDNALAILSRPVTISVPCEKTGEQTDGGRDKRNDREFDVVPAKLSADVLAEMLASGVRAAVMAAFNKHDAAGDADRAKLVATWIDTLHAAERPAAFEGRGRGANGLGPVEIEMLAAFKVWFAANRHELEAADQVRGTGKSGRITVADVVGVMAAAGLPGDFASVLDAKGAWDDKAIVRWMDTNAPHKRAEAEAKVEARSTSADVAAILRAM